MEVAVKAGMPVTAVARTPGEAEPKAVRLLPEEVTAPLRFALVVTVAALPLMLMLTGEEVEIEAKVLTPVA